jgi:hypothetical protein
MKAINIKAFRIDDPALGLSPYTIECIYENLETCPHVDGEGEIFLLPHILKTMENVLEYGDGDDDLSVGIDKLQKLDPHIFVLLPPKHVLQLSESDSDEK